MPANPEPEPAPESAVKAPEPPAQKPVAKKSTAKKPAAKKSVAKTGAAKKPASKATDAGKSPAKAAKIGKAPAKSVKTPAKATKTSATAKAKDKPAKVTVTTKKSGKSTAKTAAAKQVKDAAPAKPKDAKGKNTPHISSLTGTLVEPPAPRPPFVPPPGSGAGTSGQSSKTKAKSHTPEFIQIQNERLLDLRDQLLSMLDGMTRDSIRSNPDGSQASGSGMHQGDAGSDAFDRDFALSLLAKEQDSLYEIDQALARIQKGCYGICEISRNLIPQKRLEAIPFARLTVECQSQWEREHGLNRRFRPSNEVGFSGGNFTEDEDSETISLDEEEE